MKSALNTEELCKDLKILHDELGNGSENQKELDTEPHKDSSPHPLQPDLLDNEHIDD